MERFSIVADPPKQSFLTVTTTPLIRKVPVIRSHFDTNAWTPAVRRS